MARGETAFQNYMADIIEEAAEVDGVTHDMATYMALEALRCPIVRGAIVGYVRLQAAMATEAHDAVVRKADGDDMPF